jgi:hypothetical protein
MALVGFVQVSEPVAQRFVANGEPAGRNLAGSANMNFSIGCKWFDLREEIVPGQCGVAATPFCS